MKRSLLIASCLLLLGANSILAKSWRGIVPLRSTRADVQKLLGKPARPGDLFESYDFRGYTVTIQYAIKNVFDAADDCDNPGYYWWGYYHAPVGTVLSVEISFDHEIPLAKLKIANFNKLPKNEPDETLSVDYFDAGRGIQYSVRKRKIHSIEYGPSTVADARRKCAPDAEADAREAHANEICAQLFGPMIDSRMGLYEVSASYVLRLTFDRHGDVMALHVEPTDLYDWGQFNRERNEPFPHLSKAEYERLLAQVDRIKPRGPLVDGAVITTPDGWREQKYRAGLLRWEEATNSQRPSDAPVIHSFLFYFLKRPAT
jgi:hypothetical protein